MKEITLHDIKVPALLDIVEELREQGWIMGHDFDWAYHPARHRTDTLDSYIVHMPNAVFAFYTEKYATFFVLKYGHYIKTDRENKTG